MINIMLYVDAIDDNDERKLVEDIYLSNSEYVRSYIWKFVKNDYDADDLTSEVFIKVINNRRKFIGISKYAVSRQLMMICRCVVSDHFSSAHMRHDIPMSSLDRDDSDSDEDQDVFSFIENIAGDDNVEDNAVIREAYNRLIQLIDSLGTPEREYIMFSHYGYTSRELAVMFDKNDSTVRTIISRGKAKLREMIENDNKFKND